MNLADVLDARKMVREYTSAPVSDAAVERIVRAGLRAPSAGDARGQRLAVVWDPDLRATIASAAGQDAWVGRGYPPWLGTAPVLLGLGVAVDDYHRRYAEADKTRSTPPSGWSVPYWWVDAGAMLQNVLLATVAEGLAAGFLGEHAIPGLAEHVGWSDVTALGIVTVGHEAPSSRRPGRQRSRPRLQRVSWL